MLEYGRRHKWPATLLLALVPIPGHTVALSWILDDPWIAAKKKKETNLDQGYLDRSPEEVTFSQSIINFTYPIKKENSLSGFVMIFTIILRRKIYSKEKFGDEKRYFLFSILKVHHSRMKRNRHELAPFQGSLTKLPSPPPPCSRVT